MAHITQEMQSQLFFGPTFAVISSYLSCILLGNDGVKEHLCVHSFFRQIVETASNHIMSDQKVKPYQSDASKKEQINIMFDRIAPKYDMLNRVLSLGVDVWWRKILVKQVIRSKPTNILDIATGTGDVAIMLAEKSNGTVTGLDLSEQMLQLARRKSEKARLENVSYLQGDSENLPFEDNSFDAITVAFGVRNFEHTDKGLDECYRVLKDGGLIAVLEFSKPNRVVIKQLYNLYFKYVLPLIGRLTSKDPKAYTYLFESVQSFPQREGFIHLLDKAGFIKGKFKPLTFGICTLYWSTK